MNASVAYSFCTLAHFLMLPSILAYFIGTRLLWNRSWTMPWKRGMSWAKNFGKEMFVTLLRIKANSDSSGKSYFWTIAAWSTDLTALMP